IFREGRRPTDVAPAASDELRRTSEPAVPTWSLPQPSSPQLDGNVFRRSSRSLSDTYRARGSFARHFMHTASRSRSTFGFTFRGASGISWSTRAIVSTAFPPAKGGLPVNISYIKAPTRYARVAWLLTPVPDTHSGGLRAGDARFVGCPISS